MLIKPSRFLPLTLFLFIVLAQDNSADAQQQVRSIEQMDGPVLAEESKEEEKIKKQIPPYIMEEFQELKLNKDTFKEAESFLLSIPVDQSYDFRYKIQSNPNPTIMLKIFSQEQGDDIAIIKDHSEGNFVEILTSTSLNGAFSSSGKAYARKILRLGSYSGSELFIRLKNNMERQIVVEVRLSGPPTKIDLFNVITNSHFSVAVKKLNAIKAEMKEVEDNNRYKFKFEWGFLEREERYEEQMLRLTGVQAFVILATSIVQIYCIKSLLDKNGVV